MVVHWNQDKTVELLHINDWAEHMKDGSSLWVSWDKSNRNIRIGYSLSLYISNSSDVKYGYGYRYAIEVVYKNKVIDWKYIKDDTQLAKGYTYNLYREFDYTDTTGGNGQLIIRGVCCGGASKEYGSGCSWGQQYANLHVVNIPAFWSNPSLNASRDVLIGRHNYSGDIKLSWDAWGDRSIDPCTIKIYFSSTKEGAKTLVTTITNGNASGSYNSFRPNSYGYGEGTEYWVHIIRTHDHTGSNASVRANLFTYHLPNISNLYIDPSPANANYSTDVKFTVNHSCYWFEKFAYDFYINGYKFNTTNSSGGSGVATKTFNNGLGTYYLASGKSASASPSTTLKVIATNTDNGTPTDMGRVKGSGESDYTTKTITLRYAPTSQVTSVTYKDSNSSGSTISRGSTVEVGSSIYVSWNYPDTTYSNQNGIANGYKVEVLDSNGNVKSTFTTSNKYITIALSTTNICPCQLNKLRITPYYSTSIMGTNPLTIDFVLPISQLNAPTINYPTNNGTWVNNKFRILMKLPTDPDYNYLSDSQKSSYVYKDIELTINNKTIKYSTYPSCFSCNKLSYNKQIVINPSLAGIYPSPTSNKYEYSIKVIKNYGSTSSDLTKSKVTSRTLNISAPGTYSVSKEDKIMKSHYDTLKSIIKNMSMCYSLFYGEIIVGTDQYPVIYRSDFTNMITSLQSIASTINNYPSDGYASGRSSVKVPTVASLVSSTNEIIKNTGNPNYWEQVYDRISKFQ